MLKLRAFCRLTNAEKHDIIINVSEYKTLANKLKGEIAMAKRKKRKNSDDKLVKIIIAATAIINLIKTIIELVKDLK